MSSKAKRFRPIFVEEETHKKTRALSGFLDTPMSKTVEKIVNEKLEEVLRQRQNGKRIRLF